MPTGTIKVVYPDRGFLFIRRRGQPDLFAHVRDCEFSPEDFTERLTELDVEFDEGTDRISGKPRAINVKPLRG